MNNDLISREDLKIEITKQIAYFGERAHTQSDEKEKYAYEHCKDGLMLARQIIDNAPSAKPISGIQEKALKVVETLTEEHAINILEEGYLRRAILFDGKSAKGEWICLDGEGLKKARRGNYVIYDVDFLLDNLAREVNIMESARQWKAGKGNDND